MLVWSVFSHLPMFMLLSLVFAYIRISQCSVETHLDVEGCIIIPLLQIVCKVCQWKNFENRSIIGKDIDKCEVPHFYGPRCIYKYSLYTRHCIMTWQLHRHSLNRLIACHHNTKFSQHYNSTLHNVSPLQKNIPNILDCNLKTNYQILIVFGTNIPDTTRHQMTIQFPTSPNVCICTT